MTQDRSRTIAASADTAAEARRETAAIEARGPAPAEPAPDREAAPVQAAPPAAPRNPVRSLTLGVLVALLILFAYHIFADRITPYSSLGTVEAFLVQIAPRVSGQVVAVEVEDNQRVEHGQTLFRLDPQPFRIAVQAAEAELAAAGQDVGASTAEVESAQARVAEQGAALANVRLQAERILELVRRGVYPEARADQARSQTAQAEAVLGNAEAELERARQNLGPEGAANPQIRAAMAALEQARLDLIYATVIAPTDGLITNLRLSTGQYVTTGQPVLTFIDTRVVWITVFMRENQIGSVEPGDPVEIALDVQPGQIFRGRVESIGWGIATGQEVPAGTLPEAEQSRGWLRDPQRFPVRIEMEIDRGQVRETGIRFGSQASVIVYTEPDWVLNPVGWLWLRLVAILSYVY